MIYSDYSNERIVTPMYDKVAQKMLTLIENEEIKRKMNGILYEGGFDNFSVNGSFHMEEQVFYKDNPRIESSRRLNMAYLLLTNPQMLEVMQRTDGCFFHGTNANALPSILEYGLNSVNTSIENDINVTTGEKWSRIDGKRGFVSLTDCLDVALKYANIGPKDNNSTNTLLNFGAVIGTSLQNMEDLDIFGVDSDIPSEVGVTGKLPVEHIKFLAVPNDKVEFLKKMVGQKDIEIVGMDIKDTFFNSNYIEKLSILEQIEKDREVSDLIYPIDNKDDVKPVINQRKTSKIKAIFESLKAKINMNIKSDKTVSGRE